MNVKVPHPTRTTIGNTGWPVVCLPALCVLVLFTPRWTTAADQPAVSAAKQASGAGGQSVAAEKPNQRTKRRVATVAVYLLAGVVFCGLALLVLTVLWGHRLRRMTRKPPPRPSHTDEFWYLRPKKEIKKKDASEPPDSDTNGEETPTP